MKKIVLLLNEELAIKVYKALNFSMDALPLQDDEHVLIDLTGVDDNNEFVTDIDTTKVDFKIVKEEKKPGIPIPQQVIIPVEEKIEVKKEETSKEAPVKGMFNNFDRKDEDK
ncbi:MAG TPA: hypothetical protein PLB70_04785 [Paludibacteraceae bacterium]|nr:hypothetical protein [Paludibacteraceae bacterium]